MTHIAPSVLAALIADCEQRRPEEACGLLLGIGGSEPAIARIVPMENVWPEAEERAHRYAIDPLGQMKAEQAATAEGLDLIGMYHSHPRGPAMPSQFDRNRAWPGYWYLIVGFEAGSEPSPRLWALDNTGEFAEHLILSEKSI